MKRRVIIYLSLVCCLRVSGQDVNDEINKFTPFIQALYNFSKNVPQEKVYLHFDNTGYYQGDNIWYKCYVVTTGHHLLSSLSQTLYVELLNPGGEVVDKRILKIENGQCHGEFTLDQLPFYSGFYEVRAYTKYMLNFGEEVVFSRLLPVFNKPKTEGAFEEKEMMRYGRYGAREYPMKRERPLRGKKVNLRFFPEGGHLVQGVTSRVAFEATDEAGNPIAVTGVIQDDTRKETGQITTLHEGKGIFICTPAGESRRKDVAIVEYDGKKYPFDLPVGLPQGVVMETDNLSCPDSMGITLRRNRDTPAEMMGIAILNGGKLYNYLLVYLGDDTISFAMDKTCLPAGVSQIVLFNAKGDIICDRLVFTGNDKERLTISAHLGKPVYRPYELVDMELSVTDHETNPVYTTFSLSIRDGENEVENNHNILTDLLLMSDIKGFVRNPSWYFEENDTVETLHATSLTKLNTNYRAEALDLLLMVQGWRRYSWEQMAGVETTVRPPAKTRKSSAEKKPLHVTALQLKYLPEQGIETHGRVVSLVRQTPKPNVDVGLFLQQKREEEDDTPVSSAIETFVTDEQGRFAFSSDVSGRWNMILTVKEKGKRKDHLILLDRVFSPEPRRYRYADLQINLADKKSDDESDDETIDEPFDDDYESFLTAYHDSIAKLGIDEKIQRLPEVTVKAKKRTREQDIYHNRSTSVAYYDVASEMDDIYDSGKYIGDDIHQMLTTTNKDFITRWFGVNEFLLYKGKMMIFIVNYEKTRWDEMGYFKYKTIRTAAIKSLYINEHTSVIAQYIESPNPMVSPMEIAMGLSCAVFFETYPEGQVSVDGAKGIRKTWLEGYSAVKEFYNPNYAELPPQDDYRRTLYWNPSVTTDETGNAKVQFYNNSHFTNLSISAETVTPQGMIGVYKK